jgi:hypothetical protein
MLHLRGADAERQGAERAMGGGMGISTHQGHTGQGRPLLRTHHMHDALARIVHAEEGDLKLVAVLLQGADLQAGDGVRNTPVPVRGRHVMVGGGHVGRGAPGLPARQAQSLEGLGRGHLMDQMPVDIEEGGPVLVITNHMVVPELVVQGFGCHLRYSQVESGAA